MTTGVISNPNAPSPTVTDIYSQASDGYDRMLGEEAVYAVVKEKEANLDDKELVDGSESLYDTLYQRILPLVTPIEVEGSEGLVDFIKAGVVKVIQLIKDFFIWLKNMVFGKSERIKRSGIEIEHKLRSGKLRTTPARYPHTAGWLYYSQKGVGYIPDTPVWLEDVADQILDVLNKESSVQNLFTNALTDITENGTNGNVALENAMDSYGALYKLKPQTPNGYRGLLIGSAELGVYNGSNGGLVFGVVKLNGLTNRVEFTPNITVARNVHAKVTTIENKLKKLLTDNEKCKSDLIKKLNDYSKKGSQSSITAIKALISSYTGHTKKIQRLALDATLGINDILSNCFE